ncbi:CUB and sushi domain-containing protein 3 [Trichonephila clavata]|uniref:CUB and sushi domain-containing protein 3 n=1 Tax=Trichonephila clavata TaxID=2740835 RepID=A0A8X6G8F9_TRICU|nr:CUB and sushi domain-containing protein 3 [Trichonephila clavata]
MKALPHFHLCLSNRTYMDRSVLICYWVVLLLLCGVWKVSPQRQLDYGCNNICGGCGQCQDTTCPALTPPDNGYVDGQCNPGIAGQSCIIFCDSGYAIEGGPSQLTCLASGQWSSYTPYCRRNSECPKLQKPWNGQIIGVCDRYVGAECQFECRSPYRLVGSQVRTCRSDGTWSGRTSACELGAGCNNNCGGCGRCQDTTCLAIFAPENGYVDGQCNPGTAGQSCIFFCDNGYAIEGGPSRLTCLPSGQWSSYTPYCRRTSGAICAFFDVPNGEADCVVDGGLTVCRVSCNAGYMLVGSSVVTCSSSGTWNEIMPSCRRSTPDVTNVCPTLNAPDGGRLVGSCTAANSGDTCQLVCISGYRPTDTRVLICQANGQWSSSLPRCISSGCPDIRVPFGTNSGACTPGTPGQICTITCQPGYTLTGTGTLICQTNGQWSGSIPTCSVRSCPALQPPASGGNSGSCSPGVVGQSCAFYCNSGFRLVGQANLVCGSNGQWSGNPPQCAAEGCPSLNPPQHGSNSGACTRSSVGQSCTFVCDSGYTLSGQSTLYCQAGNTWSSSPPVCVAPAGCPDLNPPANGAISGSCRQVAVGQSCSFSCQAGYTLVGQETLYCQTGGRWSSNTPSCNRAAATSCASLVAPGNGYMLGTCSPGRVGETCVFTCDSNYVIRGQRTLTCEPGGYWSSNQPRCERGEVEGGPCPILSPPPNGDFESCDNRLNGRCVVVCDQGFLRTGSRVRTCLSNGMWSGYAPTCTRKVGYTTTYTYKVVPLWSLVFG